MKSLRSSTVGVPESRQATSSVHPGRSCCPCALCNKGNLSKYSHPKTWKNPLVLQQLQEFEPSLNLHDESCICQPCRRDVLNLNSGDGSFTPRWRKSKEVKKCFVNGCPNCTDIKMTKVLAQFFECTYLSAESECANIPLCNSHYNKWHKHLHGPSHLKYTIPCHQRVTLIHDIVNGLTL